MQYLSNYSSPLGNILLASNGKALTGLWFEGMKAPVFCTVEKPDLAIFGRTKKWLDIYFSGKKPTFTPRLEIVGTEFRQQVCRFLLSIPYGETRSYGQIAQIAAQQLGRTHLSAQAVGHAVGHNPIAIIIPCHRVVGADNSLKGYAGGIERKRQLLIIEKNKLYSNLIL